MRLFERIDGATLDELRTMEKEMVSVILKNRIGSKALKILVDN